MQDHNCLDNVNYWAEAQLENNAGLFPLLRVEELIYVLLKCSKILKARFVNQKMIAPNLFHEVEGFLKLHIDQIISRGLLNVNSAEELLTKLILPNLSINGEKYYDIRSRYIRGYT